MSSNAEEKAALFQSLAQAVIDITGTELIGERRARQEMEARFGSQVAQNPLGDDLEPADLDAIERLFRGEAVDLGAFDEAQLREMAFWRWVAFEGYGGKDPRIFPFHQQHFMLSTFYRTGWKLADFNHASILELGCGPLGMIEYLSGEQKVAFDPLNPAYARLFAHCRQGNVTYLSRKDQLINLPQHFNLVICHNVIDHTEDPSWWFDTFFSKLEDGGQFLFQVNLSKADFPQHEDHRKMHPSPFLESQIKTWIEAKSDDYAIFQAAEPSADNEFYFLAWGRKTRDEPVHYACKLPANAR